MTRSAANRASEVLAPCSCPNDDFFVDELADRIAAICTGQLALTDSEAIHAVPLPHKDEMWREEKILQRRDFAGSGQVPKPDCSAVALYTREGHLRPLEDIEADILRLAVVHYRGRISEVARRLNLGRSTVYRKLNDIGYIHR